MALRQPPERTRGSSYLLQGSIWNQWQTMQVTDSEVGVLKQLQGPQQEERMWNIGIKEKESLIASGPFNLGSRTQP